jgi:hypothetical protein
LAVSGHAAAVPPSSVMNSRRFMGNMGTFLPCRLASSPLTLGLPQAQPAAEEPASPWGRPELF